MPKAKRRRRKTHHGWKERWSHVQADHWHGTVLPVQFVSRQIARSPESRLWVAVLAQAVDDYRLDRERGLGKQAAAWLTDRTSRGVGTMGWVCEVLGLDREAVVAAVFGEHQDARAGWRLP